MRKLLVPVDGSPVASRAMSFAIEQARRSGDMEINLLNVQQSVERWYKHGLLSDEGIVMGTRGPGDVENLMLGSTAYMVVQLAEVPVTLVK